MRRFGIAQRLAPGSGTPRKFRRLSVVEVCTVDGRRRLVLLRRDGVEHLVMLSANGGGFVVERGIGGERPSFARTLDDETAEDDEAAEHHGAAPTLAPGFRPGPSGDAS